MTVTVRERKRETESERVRINHVIICILCDWLWNGLRSLLFLDGEALEVVHEHLQRHVVCQHHLRAKVALRQQAIGRGREMGWTRPRQQRR